MNAYEEVIQDLTQFYSYMENDARRSGFTKPSIDNNKFHNKLTLLKQQLEMMDSVQAIDSITYLTSHSYADQIITATLADCKDDIADFEYDRAIDKINTIFERINNS